MRDAAALTPPSSGGGSPDLEALYAARSRAREIPGFSVAVDGAEPRSPARDRVAAGLLDAFLGPYGELSASGSVAGMSWAAAWPKREHGITTWSRHVDGGNVCLVEGDFYANVLGHRPRIGDDPAVAENLLTEFLKRGPEALNELSGLFSGFIFSESRHRLWLFTDPSGSRMLFYRLTNGRCEAASSVYGLAAGYEPLRIDPLALNEDLAFGAPLRNRTLFRDVRVVPPGKAIEFDGSRAVAHRYFRFPERRPRMSRAEIGELICTALEAAARHVGAAGRDEAIGISGGKDSRVAAAAVVYAGLRPRAIAFRLTDPDGDAVLGLRVAEALRLPAATLGIGPLAERDEMIGLSSDAALLTDGSTPGMAYLALGAIASQSSSLLFTGFFGDCLSGAWHGVEPWKARTIRDLAQRNRDAFGFVVSPSSLADLLPEELRVSADDLLRDWEESYGTENLDSENLVSAHIAQRITERYRRCTATLFHSVRAAITPVQLFAARDAMNAYLTIPVTSLIAQRAHIDAASHRFRELGQIPSWKTRGRIPLTWEPSAQALMRIRYALRFRRRNRPPRAASAPILDPSSWSLRTRRFSDALKNSSILNQDHLRREFLPRLSAGDIRTLHKLASTAIHVEYGLHRSFLLPPFFLERRPAQRETR